MPIDDVAKVDINSSNISAAAHDEKDKVLRVWFNNGAVYDYASVPRNIYMGLVGAESAGKYFHAHIRNAFEYRKV